MRFSFVWFFQKSSGLCVESELHAEWELDYLFNGAIYAKDYRRNRVWEISEWRKGWKIRRRVNLGKQKADSKGESIVNDGNDYAQWSLISKKSR